MEQYFIIPELYIWLYGFLFNFVWEISHMPYYKGYYNFYNKDKSVEKRYWFGENTFTMRKTFAGVFWFASAFDGLLILGHYWVVSLLFMDRFWFIDGGTLFGQGEIAFPIWAGYLIALLLGIFWQVVIEMIGLARDWWGYSPEMPMLGRKFALLPNAQMILPVILSILLTRYVILGLRAALQM